MSEAHGYEAQVGIGEETNWASGSITPTNFFPITSESLKKEKEMIFPDHQRGSSARRVVREGKETVGGDISTEVQPEGLMKLFKHALGATSTIGPSGSLYTHWVWPSGTLPAGLTIEVDRDTKVFTYNGCKISETTLDCSLGEPLTATFSILGKDESTGDTATKSANISILTPYNFDECTVYMDGHTSTNEINVTSCSLTINNNLKDDKGKLGQKTRNGLPRNGLRDVTGSINMAFENNEVYDKFVNATDSLLRFNFSSIQNNTTYQMNICLPKVVFTGETPTADGVEEIYHDLPFTAIYNEGGSDIEHLHEVSIKFINTESSI